MFQSASTGLDEPQAQASASRSAVGRHPRVYGLAALVVVSWWLFADTYDRRAACRRHVPSTAGRLADADSTVIRFAHFGDYQDYVLWREVLSHFEQANPGLRVKQEYTVGMAGRYNTKMRQQIGSGTLPDVALIQLGPFHGQAHHFADLSYLLDASRGATGLMAADFDATAMAAFRVGGGKPLCTGKALHNGEPPCGRQRGLPVWGGNLQIFGNAECFERADRFHGEPVPRPADDWTMEDFRRTAELLTCDFDHDGRIDQFGFWLPRWVYYLPFLWSFGAEFTDETATHWKLVGPEAQQALSFYRELAEGNRVCPRAEEVPQLFQDVGFLTGRVALCVNGPWFMPFLAKTKLADSYFIAPIPRGPAGRFTRVTWDGLVMAEGLGPKRRAAAERLITFMLSSHVQDQIARAGRALPARRQSVSAFREPQGGHEAASRRQRFVDALSHSRLQPLHPRFAEFDRVINEHFAHLIDPQRGGNVETTLRRLAGDPVIQSVFPATDTHRP